MSRYTFYDLIQKGFEDLPSDESMLDEAYEEAYDDGWDIGYTEGYNEGGSYTGSSLGVLEGMVDSLSKEVGTSLFDKERLNQLLKDYNLI